MQSIQNKQLYHWSNKSNEYQKLSVSQLTYISSKVRQKTREAQKRNIPYSLTLFEFAFLSKIDKCAYTGATLDGAVKLNARSIERIDSNKGYSIDNVCVVTSQSNILKERIDFYQTRQQIIDEVDDNLNRNILISIWDKFQDKDYPNKLKSLYTSKDYQDCFLLARDSNDTSDLSDWLEENNSKRNARLKGCLERVGLLPNSKRNSSVTEAVYKNNAEVSMQTEDNNDVFVESAVETEAKVAEKYLEAVKLAKDLKVRFSLSLGDFKRLSLTKSCKLSGLPLSDDSRFFFLKDRVAGFSKGNVVVVDKGIGLALNAKNRGDDGHKVINRIGKNIQKLFS